MIHLCFFTAGFLFGVYGAGFFVPDLGRMRNPEGFPLAVGMICAVVSSGLFFFS